MIFSKTYQKEYKNIWKIAYPLVLGNAGHMITSIADTIMVGQLGSQYLAAASVAHIVFVLLFVFGIGLSNGVTPLVGKAWGEKDYIQLQRLFKYSLFTIIPIGIVITIVMILSANIIPYLGQEEKVAQLAIPYYYIVAFSMFPYMIFLSYKQFVDGLAKTKPAMTIIVVWNLANVFLNYAFIYGKFGFPEMGLNGAAVATLIARTMMAVTMIAYMHKNSFLNQFTTKIYNKKYSLKTPKEILKLGTPIGLQHILEVGAFAISAVMIGWLGATSLAAHQIVISLASLTFLMSGGVANAATVRISNIIGEGNIRQVRISGSASFIMVISFMGTAAVIFILGRYFLPSLFINEAEVLGIASQLLIIAAFFQIMDGTQVTALGTLRGMEDVRVPTYISTFAYWGLMLPTAYLFGVSFNMGAVGIWYGFVIGLLGAASGLFMRYNFVSKKITNGFKVVNVEPDLRFSD